MNSELTVIIKNKVNPYEYNPDFRRSFDISPSLLYEAWKPVDAPSDNQDPIIATMFSTPPQELRKVLRARENAKEIILRHIGEFLDEWLNQFDKIDGYNKDQQREMHIPLPNSMKIYK